MVRCGFRSAMPSSAERPCYPSLIPSEAAALANALPVISGMPAAGCTLWPPNDKLVQVATVTATTSHSGVAPGSFKVTGTSNEPPDPNTDIVITSNGSGGFNVQLRASRLGTGTGRIYTLT